MMKPEEITEAFLYEMNPTNWNGQGEMPAEFDTGTLCFLTDMPDVRLEISFELCDSDNSDDFEWGHFCELVQESSNTTVECFHGYGIDSVQNIADTIRYLLEANVI